MQSSKDPLDGDPDQREGVINEDSTQSAEKTSEGETEVDAKPKSDGTSKEKPKYKRILGNKLLRKAAKKKYIKYQLKIQMKYGKEPRFEDLIENDDFKDLLAECKQELEQEDVQTKINEAKLKAEEAKKAGEKVAEEAENGKEANKSNDAKKHLCESHKKKWIKYQLKLQKKYGKEPRYGDLVDLPNFNELFETCKNELQLEEEYNERLKNGDNAANNEDSVPNKEKKEAETQAIQGEVQIKSTSDIKNQETVNVQKEVSNDSEFIIYDQYTDQLPLTNQQITEEFFLTDPENVEQETNDEDSDFSQLSSKQKQKFTRSQQKKRSKWFKAQKNLEADLKSVDPPKATETVNEPSKIATNVEVPPNIKKNEQIPPKVTKTVKEPPKVLKPIKPVESNRLPKPDAESKQMKILLSQVTQIIQMQHPNALQILQNQHTQGTMYKRPAGIPRSFLRQHEMGARTQPAHTMTNQGELTEGYGQFPQIPQNNQAHKMTLNLKPKLKPTNVVNEQMTIAPEQPNQYVQQFAPNQNQQMFYPNNPMYQPEQTMFRPVLPNYNANQPIFIQNPVQNQPLFQSNPIPNQPAFESHYLNQPSSNQQLFVQTDYRQNEPTTTQQMYSPTDVYLDGSHEEEKDDAELREGSESPDFLASGQKRLSAFKRLGPLAEAKKPKLTINLIVNKDEAVREVVGDTKAPSPKPEYIPFHLRPEVTTCTDETVMKYLVYWPWKKNLGIRKIVSARNSKTAMIMEQEQMEEIYLKDTSYLQISITGYPSNWKKEQVLDALLNAVKGKSLIPCFINFSETECQFLVIRNYSALVAIHKMNFVVQTENAELKISIIDRGLSLNHLDFLPRLILSKRMSMGYDGTKKLSLKQFTLQEEVSHFIYFPLHRHTNQTELVQLQSVVVWDYITDLDLSHNKLRSIDGFDLTLTCPRLKHLDLSHNCLEKITVLMRIRSLPLNSLKLEGNPLVLNYIDSQHYVKVLRMIFSSLREIDGIKFKLKGELPTFQRNYCPEECYPIVSKFLETFFPLMDSPIEDRPLMENLYDENAVLTITYKYKLRYSSVFRYFRNIFLRSRVLEEGDLDSIRGAANICKHYSRWPALKHDPFTFTVDVVWCNESSLIIRVSGILKLTAETLAEDEEILSFTRTFVLRSDDGIEYQIANEMVYWENATEECMNNAFKITTLKPKRLSLKLESAPDDDLKEKMTILFMKLTNMDKKPSERCLELKDWNFKNALQLFHKLLQVDNLDYLLEAKNN